MIDWLVKKLMPSNEVFMTPEERAYYAEEARMLKLRNDLIEEGRRKRKEREESDSAFRVVALVKLDYIKFKEDPIDVRVTLSKNNKYRRWEVAGAKYRNGARNAVPREVYGSIQKYISTCDDYFDLILPWLDEKGDIAEIAKKTRFHKTSLLTIY